MMEKQSPENSEGQWWFSLWVKFLVLARANSAAWEEMPILGAEVYGLRSWAMAQLPKTRVL